MVKLPKHRAPFETQALRKSLREFLETPYTYGSDGQSKPVGTFKWGVYIFYDYDGEPIYVGQTKEKISGRIGRHLTNQRTDAVAMSVLDPYEVYEIEIYPLPQFENVKAGQKDFKVAKQTLDALEYQVHQLAIAKSKFRAILNEKDPLEPENKIELPKPLKGTIVSQEILTLRGHPDTRMARRTQVVSRLAQTIAEREVKVGLRRTLLTQANRLRWLAEQRFNALGGEAGVEKGTEEAAESEEDGDA